MIRRLNRWFDNRPIMQWALFLWVVGVTAYAVHALGDEEFISAASMGAF